MGKIKIGCDARVKKLQEQIEIHLTKSGKDWTLNRSER